MFTLKAGEGNLVRKGQRILEGVAVNVTKIAQLGTPEPLVSDKDADDLCKKLRFLIDKTETLVARLNGLSAVLDSTTAVLAIDGVFTGVTMPAAGWGRIVGSCYADVAGTLRVEQRNDGVNWDVRSSFAYAAGDLMGFSVEVVGNEARVVYVNGATAQTAFRLHVRARRI